MRHTMVALMLGGALTVAAVTVPVVSVSAQSSYDIKQMTPAVKSALDARKDRFGQLKALKAQALVGENNRGYIEALGEGLTVADLVAAENRDRKVIYETIVEQNSLGGGALPTVEGVFAGVQRGKAAAGERIQNEDGQWVTK